MEMTLALLLTRKVVRVYQKSEKYYRKKKISSPKWNGGVGPEQMELDAGSFTEELKVPKKRSSCFATFLFIRKIPTTFGMPRK